MNYCPIISARLYFGHPNIPKDFIGTMVSFGLFSFITLCDN